MDADPRPHCGMGLKIRPPRHRPSSAIVQLQVRRAEVLASGVAAADGKWTAQSGRFRVAGDDIYAPRS